MYMYIHVDIDNEIRAFVKLIIFNFFSDSIWFFFFSTLTLGVCKSFPVN